MLNVALHLPSFLTDQVRPVLVSDGYMLLPFDRSMDQEIPITSVDREVSLLCETLSQPISCLIACNKVKCNGRVAMSRCLNEFLIKSRSHLPTTGRKNLACAGRQLENLPGSCLICIRKTSA
jgi:hypothetical protein